MSTVSDLGREKFVSVTTHRRTSEPVATPVWVVADGADLLVWTGAQTGKVKRLRHDDRVVLAPCSRRGSVDAGAPRVPGTATVSSEPAAVEHAETLLRGKYGVEFLLVTGVERLVGAVRRRHSQRVVLRISAA